MRTIIAGSRDIKDPWALDMAFRLCPWSGEITSVVCGMAEGIDLLGRTWAQFYGLPVDEHPVTDADWKQFGKSAGPRRNAEMANVADALLVVWDGASPGTRNMIGLAQKKGLKIYVHRL